MVHKNARLKLRVYEFERRTWFVWVRWWR